MKKKINLFIYSWKHLAFFSYKDNEEKTAKVFTTDFYLTGDQAHVDEDGYFWFASRKDDVIMSAGWVTSGCYFAVQLFCLEKAVDFILCSKSVSK